MPADIDLLAAEYAQIAARVHQLTRQLDAAIDERNAILSALSHETDLTQWQICVLVGHGLTIARLRAAVHNHWLATHDRTGATA